MLTKSSNLYGVWLKYDAWLENFTIFMDLLVQSIVSWGSRADSILLWFVKGHANLTEHAELWESTNDALLIILRIYIKQRMQNQYAEYIKQNVECRIKNAECRKQNAKDSI